MLKFVVYLFESGICLSVLFLLYVLFFRKETYFNFNRYYLIGIIALSLIIPLLHVNIRVKQHPSIEPTMVEIGKIRNYYERLFVLSDPDFSSWYDNGLPRAVFEEQWDDYESIERSKTPGQNNTVQTATFEAGMNRAKQWSIFTWLFFIYSIGVIVFITRFISLITRLLWQLHKYKIIERFGLRLVMMPSGTPPFSFFRYVFVDEALVELEEFEQILAHERVHIYQSHSIDLILAQALVIFQWFNPLVWQVQKAIKINHEFIADRKVVDGGHELLDYQTLLLSQLISIRSVELVNNFNLISIKKRITMMSQIQSGFKAKFKALIAIPATVLLLFIFTDMTISSPILRFSNYSPITFKLNQPSLNGLWKSTDSYADYSLISFDNSMLNILDKNNTIRNYSIDISSNNLIINHRFNEKVKVPFKTSGKLLTIWWKPDEPVKYQKTAFNNSLDLFLSETQHTINLPHITHYQILEKMELAINVIAGDNYFEVDGIKGDISSFEQLIKQAKNKRNVLDQPYLIVNFNLDKNTKMGDVSTMYQILRQNHLLKVAYTGYVKSSDVPDLLKHSASIPKLLPPMDAVYMSEEDVANLKAKGEFLEIKAHEKAVDSKFKNNYYKQLEKSEGVVVKLLYDNATSYERYLQYVDAIYVITFQLRDNFARKEHGIAYQDLSSTAQKQIRKRYPMRITEFNIDKD